MRLTLFIGLDRQLSDFALTRSPCLPPLRDIHTHTRAHTHPELALSNWARCAVTSLPSTVTNHVTLLTYLQKLRLDLKLRPAWEHWATL